MTQKQRILDYISKFGSITPYEAFSDLGITKLSNRISELKHEGIAIHTEMVSSLNRYGDKTHYCRYSLEEEK